jgi:phosphotransferase system  glucose/maltose/N-acetylglucosamine-specific IIC component
MLLRLWCWLVSFSLLHVGHSLLHGLQHLSLHYQNLLKCWWWRWVVGVVVVVVVVVVVLVVVTMVASVSHLMIVKRFETELKIEIQDSQLYASSYTDD